METCERVIRINSSLARKVLSEFFGTFLLVYIGSSAGAAYFLYGGTGECSNTSKIFAATFSGGIGLIIALMTTINVSGGHINPNVTLSLAMTGQFPLRHVPVYVFSQYLGAFTAAIMMFATYFEAIDHTHFDLLALGSASDVGNETISSMEIYDMSTASLFFSTPAPHSSLGGSFLNHVMASMIFMLAICAITDKRNINAPAWAQCLAIGLDLMVVSQSFSANAGAIVNPAADLSPRLFTAMAGWGPGVFAYQGGHYWWLSGVIAPHVGGVIGALLYRTLIGAHCRSPMEDEIRDHEEDRELNARVKFIVDRKA